MEETSCKTFNPVATTIFPSSCALVLEGGGARCCYTGGVLDALLRAGIVIPNVVGVSAGAGNALSYVSGQVGRNKEIALEHVTLPDYMGFGNWVRGGSFVNMEYMSRTVPECHCFFDWEAFYTSPARLFVGAFDCLSGETHWFGKEDLWEGSGMTPIVASCSLPFLCPMVEYQGCLLLDGGARDAIPIEKSVAMGHEFHVIVLTKEAGVRRRPEYRLLARNFYRKYPKVVEMMEERHLRYNAQLDLCQELERQGRAVIIRPGRPVAVGRTDRNRQRLRSLYEEGEEEGAEVASWLKELLPKEA